MLFKWPIASEAICISCLAASARILACRAVSNNCRSFSPPPKSTCTPSSPILLATSNDPGSLLLPIVQSHTPSLNPLRDPPSLSGDLHDPVNVTAAAAQAVLASIRRRVKYSSSIFVSPKTEIIPAQGDNGKQKRRLPALYSRKQEPPMPPLRKQVSRAKNWIPAFAG